MRTALGERAGRAHLQRFTRKKGHPKAGCPITRRCGYLGFRRPRPKTPSPSRPRPTKANVAGSGTTCCPPAKPSLDEVPKDTTTLLTRVLLISPLISATSNIVVPREGLCEAVMPLFALVYEERVYDGPPPMIRSVGWPPVKSFKKNELPVKLNCQLAGVVV